MKFPEMKIGEAAAHVDSKLSQAAPQIGMKLAEKVAPMAASVESVAGQVTSFAEKNWPKPPLPARPSPLPPLKKPVKAPLPPPIRPRNLRRD
jgi:hypothetical protein